MSFILDALKKSEAERQRQAGPTLLELRITRPSRRYPLWSLVVGGLLAANIVVLLVFVLRRPAATSAQSTANVAATPAQAPAPAPAPTSTSPSASAAPLTTAPAVVRPPPAAVAAAPVSSTAVSGGPATPATDSPAANAADTSNPADDEPALPPGSAPQRASSANYSNLPSITELSGNVPALQLDLLDYSELASERYALINMHRVHEGDVLPEGARVLAITRDGVALDYRGQSFMLRPGGTAAQ